MPLVADEQALDALTRTLLRTLNDSADAGRLKSAEARSTAGAICRHLLGQACVAAASDPLEALRAFEPHAEIIESFLTTVAQEQVQDDGRPGQPQGAR